MKFSKALKKLRKGEKVTRNEWPDGCYLKIENDQENWSLYHPTIYFEPADENQSHGIWTPHQADILASDWRVCPIDVDIKIDNSELDNDCCENVGMENIGNIMYDRILKMMNDGLITGYDDGGNQQ